MSTIPMRKSRGWRILSWQLRTCCDSRAFANFCSRSRLPESATQPYRKHTFHGSNLPETDICAANFRMARYTTTEGRVAKCWVTIRRFNDVAPPITFTKLKSRDEKQMCVALSFARSRQQ